jgi:hypothetical protein
MATDNLDFSFAFVSTPGFYEGVTVRFATGSGTGSETAVGVRVVPRTATGSGSGSSSVAYFEILSRSATGTGLGSSGGGATGLLTAIRTANGSGIGSGSVVFFAGKLRTATGSGLGSSSAVSVASLFRTATASGNGSETGSGIKVLSVTATSSGTGTQSATGIKLFLFRTPTDDIVHYADNGGTALANRLFRFFEPEPRGRNVYKLTDNSFTENEQNDESLVSVTYHGGHDNFVSQQEKDDLVAAGYSEYIT